MTARVTVPTRAPGMLVDVVTDPLIQNDQNHEERITALAVSGQNTTTGANAFDGKYHADAYSGIDPSGSGDSTAAINTLFATTLPAGATVYFPPGTYKITGTLTQPKYECVVEGAGDGNAGGTIFSFNPSTQDDMMDIVSQGYITFKNIQFLFGGGTGPAASTFFNLNNAFCSKWIDCTFRGQHTAVGDIYGTPTSNHTAFHFTNNAGDNWVRGCKFLNLGKAVISESIQNGFTDCKWGYCYVGIEVPDTGSNGGFSIGGGYNIFVSGTGTFGTAKNLSHAAIQILGAAGQCHINSTWIEGYDYGIIVGKSGSGPSQFCMSSSKVSAYLTCITINHAANPSLTGVQTGQGTTSYSVLAGGSKGVANGLTSNQSGDAQFPGGQPSGSAIFGTGNGWVLNGATV